MASPSVASSNARTWRVSALQILRFLALHAPEELQDRMMASPEVRRLEGR